MSVPAGWRLEIAESLPSTSDALRARAEAGEPGHLALMARVQTAVRGRAGRGWASPPGNLYLSVLLRPR
ncbi:MAG: biotin--[acetyl-CoA-carboxylase] ligase, partial [Acetobacteraceae bacterium]|nr:biotin--[acetyl-CoA-carboxylase] ligase [Acetobacteraceae bacterium]